MALQPPTTAFGKPPDQVLVETDSLLVRGSARASSRLSVALTDNEGTAGGRDSIPSDGQEIKFWWMGDDVPNDEGPPPGEPPSGVAGATFNLINCILDAGIVGVPYVFGQSGLPLGIVLVLIAAVATCFTLELLITISDRACRTGAIACVAYEELAELAGGPIFRSAVLLTQFLFCIGALVGYIIVVKDNLATSLFGLTSQDWLDHRYLVTLGTAVLILLPLCCLRSVADIGHVSAITIGVVVGIIVIFAYELGYENDCPGCPNPDYALIAKSGSVDTIGICIFAFLCHHNQFSIYRSLGSGADPVIWKGVVRKSVAFATTTSVAIGMLVFAVFGDGTKSDIFENYPNSRTLVNIARALMSLNMLLSFPMNFGVARETVQILITEAMANTEVKARHSISRTSLTTDLHKERRRSRMSCCTGVTHQSAVTHASRQSCMSFDETGRPLTLVWSVVDRPPLHAGVSAAGGGTREQTSTSLHVLTTLPLFAFAIGIGLVAPDLGPTLDLVGGLLGSLLGFVFPAYFALQLEENPPGGRWTCWIVLVSGCALGMTATVTSIRDIVT